MRLNECFVIVSACVELNSPVCVHFSGCLFVAQLCCSCEFFCVGASYEHAYFAEAHFFETVFSPHLIQWCSYSSTLFCFPLHPGFHPGFLQASFLHRLTGAGGSGTPRYRNGCRHTHTCTFTGPLNNLVSCSFSARNFLLDHAFTSYLGGVRAYVCVRVCVSARTCVLSPAYSVLLSCCLSANPTADFAHFFEVPFACPGPLTFSTPSPFRRAVAPTQACRLASVPARSGVWGARLA